MFFIEDDHDILMGVIFDPLRLLVVKAEQFGKFVSHEFGVVYYFF